MMKRQCEFLARSAKLPYPRVSFWGAFGPPYRFVGQACAAGDRKNEAPLEQKLPNRTFHQLLEKLCKLTLLASAKRSFSTNLG